jgi:hypothetical protein
MQSRLLAAVAAMLFVPAGILFAAGAPKPMEAKTPPAATAQPVTITFLGVAVIHADAAVCHQTGLPCGVGLLVESVVKDGPAAKAGIVRDDVLGKFNDQLLIDTHQLGVLVRMHKPGEQVTLTYYRNGKSETTPVTLGIVPPKEKKVAFNPSSGYEFGSGWPLPYGETPGYGPYWYQMERQRQGFYPWGGNGYGYMSPGESNGYASPAASLGHRSIHRVEQRYIRPLVARGLGQADYDE